MRSKNVGAAAIGILLLSGLLVGCSSATPDAKKSAEPYSTSTQQENNPDPIPTQDENDWDPIYYLKRGKPNVIKNELDQEFLDIAEKSCIKAYEDGLIFSSNFSGAEEVSYFKQGQTDSLGWWKLSQVTVTKDGVQSPGIWFNYLPAIFDPCDVMIQGAMDIHSKVLEHSLKKNKDGSYDWGQHHGGANLDVVNYKVGPDGLFSEVFMQSVEQSDEVYKFKATYGPLTQEQLDYFK